MIDKFQRIAQAIQILKLPSIIVGFICLASFVIIVLNVSSDEGNRFVMPTFVGLVWAATTFSFIATFRTVPERAEKSQGIVRRFKQGSSRAWYWFIGVVFIGTSLAALIMTGRLVSVWLKEYVS
jgi:hypothetical protein